MQIFEILKSIPVELGAQLMRTEEHPKDFGHALAIYSRATRAVRVVWDGKERLDWLEASDGTSWVTCGPVLRGDEPVELQQSAIEELRRAAHLALGLGAA